MIRRLLVAALLAAGLAVGGATSAQAAPSGPAHAGVGDFICPLTGFIPGLGASCAVGQAVKDAITGTVCKVNYPDIQAPRYGVVGALIPEPRNPPTGDGFTNGKPDQLWQTSGMGGFLSWNWNLSCVLDPLSYVSSAGGFISNQFTNVWTNIGLSATALGDATDRVVYDPTWVTTGLGHVSRVAVHTVELRLLGLLCLLGLAVLSIELVVKARKGDVASTAVAVGWAVCVLVVLGVVLTLGAAPVATTLQAAAGAVATELHGGAADPAAAMTNTVVATVHYPMWQDRTFGVGNRAMADKYGPRVFAATRFTYAEQAAMAKDPKATAKIMDRKHADLDAALAALGKERPDVLNQVTGAGDSRAGLGFLEMVYAVGANAIRVVADLILAVALIMVVVLAVVWVIVAGWVLTPRGQELGMSVLNAGVRAAAYALLAGVASWGWGVYTSFALDPALSPLWSIALLYLGLAVFWVVLSPTRKLLSLVSFGRVKGGGKAMRLVTKSIVDYVVTRKAVADGEGDAADVAAPVRSEDYSPPQPQPVVTLTRDRQPWQQGWQDRPAVAADSVPAEPDRSAVLEGAVVYHRPITAGAEERPAATSKSTDVEVYHRPTPAGADAREDADL